MAVPRKEPAAGAATSIPRPTAPTPYTSSASAGMMMRKNPNDITPKSIRYAPQSTSFVFR